MKCLVANKVIFNVLSPLAARNSSRDHTSCELLSQRRATRERQNTPPSLTGKNAAKCNALPATRTVAQPSRGTRQNVVSGHKRHINSSHLRRVLVLLRARRLPLRRRRLALVLLGSLPSCLSHVGRRRGRRRRRGTTLLPARRRRRCRGRPRASLSRLLASRRPVCSPGKTSAMHAKHKQRQQVWAAGTTWQMGNIVQMKATCWVH